MARQLSDELGVAGPDRDVGTDSHDDRLMPERELNDNLVAAAGDSEDARTRER